MTKKKRKSLELTPAEWLELEILATDLGAFAERGPTAGQPSWRNLIRKIAEGRLKLALNEVQAIDYYFDIETILGDYEPADEEAVLKLQSAYDDYIHNALSARYPTAEIQILEGVKELHVWDGNDDQSEAGRAEVAAVIEAGWQTWEWLPENIK
jgi:hypothetical protein